MDALNGDNLDDAVDRECMIASLQRAAAYPKWPVRDGLVHHISTHVSDVFLAGDFAYKVKKPVNLGFCDFSTAQLRLSMLERELELNQRLSGDVYLSLEPITFDDEAGEYSINGDGEHVEWALRMRRLCSDDQLDVLIQQGRAGAAEIREIAGLLARFHREAPIAPRPYGTVDAVSAIVLGNLDRVDEHAQPELDRVALANIRAYATEFLRVKGELIQQRRMANRPRRCHGDLHAGNIFLEESPNGGRSIQVIDCIEFNDSFMYVDPAADVAFLSMDLKVADHPELAKTLLDAYVAASGDSGMMPLMPFYESYRAMVRCMASSVMAGQSGDNDERHRQVGKADGYLRLAGGIVAAERPQFLAITSGLTGTGKSTVAQMLAGQWGACHLQTDRIRRELAGIGITQRSGSGISSGIYTPAMSERTYREMQRRAAQALADGRSVVMDGTHLQRDYRSESLQVGRDAGVETFIIECSLSEPEAMSRLTSRYASGTSESEGRPEVYVRQVREWEPASDDEATCVVRVNTDGPAEELPGKLFGGLWHCILQAT